MQELSSKEQRFICLRQDRVYYGGMLLSYALYTLSESMERKYTLCVTYDEERATCEVGEDLLFAVDCYEVLLQGRVTPCSLTEVVDDLCYLNKKRGKF